MPAVIELNRDVLSTLPKLGREIFGISLKGAAAVRFLFSDSAFKIPTHGPNVSYGCFVSPGIPKYHIEERTAENQEVPLPADGRPLRDPSARPANSAERRLRARRLEGGLNGRGSPNRRGRAAAKVVAFTDAPFNAHSEQVEAETPPIGCWGETRPIPYWALSSTMPTGRAFGFKVRKKIPFPPGLAQKAVFKKNLNALPNISAVIHPTYYAETQPETYELRHRGIGFLGHGQNEQGG